jgi:hypothetical protein
MNKPLSTRILEYKESTIHYKDLPRNFSMGEVIFEYGEIKRIESQIEIIENILNVNPDLNELLENLRSELAVWQEKFKDA